MRTKVAITVDTEASIAGAFHESGRYKPLIHEPVWGEIGGRSEALGFILRTLLRSDLSATFFVDTVHRCYFPAETMGRYVTQLVEAGQDIQLHLHPVWKRFEGGRFGDIRDGCRDLSEDLLVELMTDGAEQIESWSGTRPVSLRTGNFSVSRKVYRAMQRAELPLGSNICLAVAPPEEEALRLAGGVHEIESIIELPVTCFRERGVVGRGRFRPMQVAACTFEEQRDLLNLLQGAEAAVVVMVTHPFEFLKWSGPDFHNLRPNRLVQRRFEQLCSFLAMNANRFDVVGFSRLVEEGIATAPIREVHGRAGSAAWRAIENFVNDRLPF